jgi:hypothetical protein
MWQKSSHKFLSLEGKSSHNSLSLWERVRVREYPSPSNSLPPEENGGNSCA